jgi:dihydroxyacetone kinase
MQTKHFFSDPSHLVTTALHSLTVTNPSLAFDPEHKIIFRRPNPQGKRKVAIVSGGGSGHEPAFAGLVGKGLLDASIAGTIFASPSAEQIRKGVMDYIDNEDGVLIIPMNYTGDVLNFGMATEKARAAGIQTEFFAINDDAGVGKKKGGKVGRRGIAGGILILKMVGALAEEGGSLKQVFDLAQLANENLASVGASLEHVHIPGRPIPEDTVPHDEIEVGMGIHNEPGSHRTKATLPELVKTMLFQILDHNDPDRAFITHNAGDEFVLLINNLGGLSTLELSGITDEVHRQLDDDYQIRPCRVLQGTFLTSLNGLGFSVSLLKVVDTSLGQGKGMLDLLDAEAQAVGWAAPIKRETWNQRAGSHVEVKKTKLAEEQPSNVKCKP